MRAIIFWILAVLIATGCKEKYMPEINVPRTGFLVVEGLIQAGAGPTLITLSRTSGLDTVHTIFEAGAEVQILSSDGDSYSLTYQDSGRYQIDQVPVNLTSKYRVHIKTSNGGEYISDYTDVKTSPPIDSVHWIQDADKVIFYVNTHDPAAQSQYYKWTFDETWQYRSPFSSLLEVGISASGRYVITHRPPDRIPPRNCWITLPSTQILISSSVKLMTDIIDEFPIHTIVPSADSRLSHRYSLLVHQTVLSKDEYEWRQKLKKNTESMGSIFDPQPSETGGNIRCISNPGQPVIGFIGCSSSTELRIFVNRDEIAGGVNNGFGDCGLSPLAAYYTLEDLYADSARYYIVNTNGVINVTVPECVDCRLLGGTSIQPSFW